MTPRSPLTPSGKLSLVESSWEWVASEGAEACVDLLAKEVRLVAPTARMTVDAQGGAVAVDRVMLRRIK